jgi:PAS domain-containing protein
MPGLGESLVAPSPPNPRDRGSRTRRGLLASAIATSVTLVAYVALVFVPHERAAAIEHWRVEREGAAESRQAAIQMWVGLRLADAESLAGQPSVGRLLSAALSPAGRSAASRDVAPLLASLVASQGVRGAFVVDASPRVVLRAGDEGSIDGALNAARAALQDSAATVELVRRDSGDVDAIFVRPVLGPATGAAGGPVLGAAVVVESPEWWLYPYLTQRLGGSGTAESILVRREDGSALFLSPLRHDSASPLTLRRPFSLPGLAAADALAGRERFGEFRDYRGDRVFAAVRVIPATSWALVTKIDRSEALAPFRDLMWRLGLAIGALLSALVGLVFLAHRAQRADRAAEVARTAARLNERFRIAAQSVSDIVYEWDLKDRVEWLGDVDGLLGWGPGEYPRTAAGHVASIHPEDLDRTMAAVEATCAERLHTTSSTVCNEGTEATPGGRYAAPPCATRSLSQSTGSGRLPTSAGARRTRSVSST